MTALRIGIDGYNLGLTQGTGIKTYGINLIKLMASAGFQSEILHAARLRGRTPQLREVSLFDAYEGSGGFLDWCTRKPRLMARSALGSKSIRIQLTNAVHLDPSRSYWKNFSAIECAEDVYRLAFRQFRYTNRAHRVHWNKPPDVWHTTTLVPIVVPGVPRITTIHDLIPIRLPWATLDEKQMFVRLLQESVRNSECIITVSEHTRQDVLEFTEAKDDQVVNVHQSVPPPPSTLTESELRRTLRTLGIEPGRYGLFVGAVEPKKNIGRLLSAFMRVPEPWKLVMVGPDGWQSARELELIKGPLRHRVVRMGYVPRSELTALMQGARALFFPSLMEGFGLPPVEAMHFSCPALISTQGSLPEVCGEASLQCDPYDVGKLSVSMLDLLENEALRKGLQQQMPEVLSRYATEVQAQALSEIYRRVAR